MTGALLVYFVAQRRLRQQVARQNETVPNQIDQPTDRAADFSAGENKTKRG